MLRGRSAVAFVSSVSSGAASSRCLLGLRRRLSLLLSLRGWTATTACSPARLLDGLQSVLNAAARLICNRRKYDHVTPLLRDVLHWVRRMRTHFGDRAFSAAGPRCWNNLPPAIRLLTQWTHLK